VADATAACENPRVTDDSPVFSPTRSATANLLFVSGQLPIDADGRVPDDIDAQTRLVLANIATHLDAHGLDFGAVVKVTYFLRDIGDLEAVRAVLREVLPRPRPAASLVEVSALVNPKCRLEIDAIAQLGGSGPMLARELP
jgi:2-iminobutanoate/2-iminopropanoate deaminase